MNEVMEDIYYKTVGAGFAKDIDSLNDNGIEIFEVPANIVNSMNDTCDSLTKESRRYEVTLNSNKDFDCDLDTFVENQIREYIDLQSSHNPMLHNFSYMGSTISGMWFNDVHPAEIGPLHMHPGSSLSVIIYLKVPEYRNAELMHPYWGSGALLAIGAEYNRPVALVVEPFIGAMVIMPSYMLHMISPSFDCEGVRRSVAFNINFKFNNIDPEDIEKTRNKSNDDRLPIHHVNRTDDADSPVAIVNAEGSLEYVDTTNSELKKEK